MLPTRLTFWLLLLGLAVLLAAAWFRPAWYVPWLVAGFDAAVLLLLAADAVLARAAGRRMRVRRDRPARLSVGVENQITLELDNPGRRRRRVVVRDEPPALFRAEPALLDAVVPGRGWVRLTYHLLPTERGNFTFGDVHLRVRG